VTSVHVVSALLGFFIGLAIGLGILWRREIRERELDARYGAHLLRSEQVRP